MPWLSALQAVGLGSRNINRKSFLAIHIISVKYAHILTFPQLPSLDNPSCGSSKHFCYLLWQKSHYPYRQNPFRIVKLLLRCPKAEIKTEYTYKSEIMDYIDLRQTVQESNPTCCLKVNLSLLGAAGEGDTEH